MIIIKMYSEESEAERVEYYSVVPDSFKQRS